MLVLVGMIGLQVTLATFSLYVISGVRAYVAGESMYSKGQKDAQIHLLDYAESQRESDYQKLATALAIPIADRRAREELQKPDPDFELARQAFLDGGNHPDDVSALIRLFRWFSKTPLMAPAIASWTEGDRVIEQMRVLVEETRRQVLAGHSDAETLRRLRLEVPALNQRLTQLESEFSGQLGEASRLAQRLLLFLNGLLALVLAASGIVFVQRTQRRQAASEALMDRLVGAVTDGVITFGADGRVRVFNAAAEQLFGVSKAQALGGPIERHFVEPLVHAQAAPAGSLHELRGRRGDGSVVPLEASFSRIETQAGALHTVIVRDITVREQARAERQAREALEATNRARTQFLSRMSHELRTPLNAVIGFAQMLRLDPLRPPSAPQLERIHHIERAGTHLLALVNDVLDLSRVESGELLVNPEAVDVAAIAEEAATLASPLVTRSGVELFIGPPNGAAATAAASPADAVWVSADRQRLRQVLLNLLSNAIKYNRPGGKVALSWRVEDTRCCIEVSDTGPGMSAVQVQRLFEPFNRLGAESGAVEGTGIGLFLSRQLAESMGGHLNITSEVGKGTVATIELDVMAPQEPPPTAAAATYPSSTVEMPFDLMYAEDNEVNAELVRQVMRLRPSVQLRIASSGGEALEMAREEPPELMLVDMHLGDMTGLELTRELRADPRTRHIELVALSADALPEQIDAAKAVGFKVYLTKPVDFSQLLQLIDERLQAR
jgi:hypothetical protein